MRVFKSCFKVLQKNMASMLIYFFIFLFFAVLLSYTNAKSDQKNTFTDTRCDIAFFDEDGNTPLVQGLKDCLSKNANFISIPDTLEGRQDALFYEDVEYIIRIPKGFTESFLHGGSVQLERTTVPNSTMGVYMDSAVRRYLSLASVAKSVPGISQTQIVTDVKSSLAQQAAVDVHSFGSTAETKKQTYYYRYLAYVIMAIVILGVSSLMMAFNQPDLRRRNLCSPLSLISMNLQLVLGNLVFAAVAFAGLAGVSFLLYGGAMLEQNTVYLLLNAFVYTLVCLSVAYLVGILIKSRNAQSAIANVLSLGTCFISGVFVPQDYLGKTVLNIASFTPTYWYVNAVNALNGTAGVTAAEVQTVAKNVFIQLGFAVALLAVALVVAKNKRTGEDMSYEELE